MSIDPPRSIRVNLEFPGGGEWPTDDGRTLRIAESDAVAAEMGLRNETRFADAPEEDLPTDILTATLRLADAEGRIWEVASSFPTDLLVARMVDLRCASSPVRVRKADLRGKAKKLFDESCVARNVVFSSDDRFYRTLTLDGKTVVSFQFKYTTLLFDVVLQDSDGSGAPGLLVRLAEGGLHDARGNDLGALDFIVGWADLFRHNTARRRPDDPTAWQTSPLPWPLRFRRCDEMRDPQAAVVVG